MWLIETRTILFVRTKSTRILKRVGQYVSDGVLVQHQSSGRWGIREDETGNRSYGSYFSITFTFLHPHLPGNLSLESHLRSATFEVHRYGLNALPHRE